MNTMLRARGPMRRCLTLATLAALLAPGLALAQTAREAELEARVAQLERQVAQLMALQQQTQARLDAPPPTPPPAADDGKPRIQSTPILTAGNPGSRFSFGGFIKLDAMYTDTNAGEMADGSAGRMFYLPSAIPVGGADEPNGDLDYTAQWSRLWFAADSEIAGRKARGYLEMDFYGGGSTAFLGNEVSTNTYGMTLRQAYVSWDKWLAGQTWSNFQDVAALPDAVDFVGPTEGTVFVRQPQVRWTNGPFSVALENPETVVTGYRSATRTISDDNALPDVTARWTTKGSWGHFGIAGLVRQLRYETPITQAEGLGYGVSLSGKFNASPSDDIRWMLTGGRGIGRYVGFALGADGVLDAAGSDIEPTGLVAGFVAWRHAFNPKLRGNLYYSASHFDNDTNLTGLGITRSARSLHANLIYSPYPKLDVGAEVMWGNRELESGADGDLRRVQTTVKYNF